MNLKTRIFERGKRGGNNDKRRSKWVLRVEYFDDDADRVRRIDRYFAKRRDAVDARPGLEANIRKSRGVITTGQKMTFGDLVRFSKTELYQAAVIINGRRRDGVKRHTEAHSRLDRLAQYFGNDKPIRKISPKDISTYSVWRSELGSQRGKKETFAPVGDSAINHELKILRRIMRVAFLKGWLLRDLFLDAKALHPNRPVIDTEAENKRGRILSDAEEKKLLSSIAGVFDVPSPRWTGVKNAGGDRRDVITVTRENSYLRAIVLLALDSGLRKSEILQLRWSDVNLEDQVLLVIAAHTKTQTERTAPLTDRAAIELRLLPSFGTAGRVFPFRDFKRAWETTRRIANIKDLRFHDLRRTAVSRWQAKGISLGIAAKIAGHADHRTTARIYTAADDTTVQMVREATNAANVERIQNHDSEFLS
jgi:integrase